jgi:hypothetical protein
MPTGVKGLDQSHHFFPIIASSVRCRYNGLLSVYYLMTIRFHVDRKVFAEKYEKWMHISTMIFFLGTSVAGLGIDLFSELE